MSILKNTARIGNVTSSEIVALTSNGKTKGTLGKPFYSYIEECIMERKLGRSIQTEQQARALTWGKLVETQVFNLLDLEYCLCSDDTFEHKTIKCWAGSPDARKLRSKTVCDVKSPLTLKSFCKLVEPLYLGLEGMDAINHVRENHQDGDKYYWQLISNAILTDSDNAELIVYVPYEDELVQIKELARERNERKFNWIANADDFELPFLYRGGHYKNINIIQFPIVKADKEFLISRVLEAEKLLPKFITDGQHV
jgi:hypothetical protein